MKLAHKLINKIEESEKSLKKIDLSDYGTTPAAQLKYILSMDGKATYDESSNSGKFNYRGAEIEFSTGVENLSFALPSMFVKDSHKEALEAMKDFLDVVANYGGFKK